MRTPTATSTAMPARTTSSPCNRCISSGIDCGLRRGEDIGGRWSFRQRVLRPRCPTPSPNVSRAERSTLRSWRTEPGLGLPHVRTDGSEDARTFAHQARLCRLGGTTGRYCARPGLLPHGEGATTDGTQSLMVGVVRSGPRWPAGRGAAVRRSGCQLGDGLWRQSWRHPLTQQLEYLPHGQLDTVT